MTATRGRGAPATSQSCFRQLARAARRADMPRSRELRTAGRRCAPPCSRSNRSGVPAPTEKGAPTTSRSCFRQQAREAKRAEMPRSHELRTAGRRCAPPCSRSNRSGVPAPTENGAPTTSRSCFRQQARAARRADRPLSHWPRTARRRRALPRSQSKRSGVQRRQKEARLRRAKAVSDSWLVQREEQTCRAVTSCGRQDGDAHCHALKTRGAGTQRRCEEARPRRAKAVSHSWFVQRGEQRCRAATGREQQDDDAHYHARKARGAG